MSSFSVGQKVRYIAETRTIHKGFVTTVLSAECEEYKKPVITITSPDGIQILSYEEYWEPVNEKPTEDLFQ